MAGPAFIDRNVFARYLIKPYEDIPTIYGDLSRLVVSLIASMEPSYIREMYARQGWGGSPNARAIHEAAKNWIAQHRPAPQLSDNAPET